MYAVPNQGKVTLLNKHRRRGDLLISDSKARESGHGGTYVVLSGEFREVTITRALCMPASVLYLAASSV